MYVCVICRSRETIDLLPKIYVSAADGDGVSVMALQAHTGMTASIATNACEEAFSRCWCVVFFEHAYPRMRDNWWHLPTFRCPCSSPSCPFWRHPWREDEGHFRALLTVDTPPYRTTIGNLLLLPVFFLRSEATLEGLLQDARLGKVFMSDRRLPMQPVSPIPSTDDV